MHETHLMLTPEEHDYLVNRLESALGEARVELRHTRLPGYRTKVREEEALLHSLLRKLHWEPAAVGRPRG